jgi:hypoxia up-regulated 1
LRNQKILLFGEEEKNYKNVPKIFVKLINRIIELKIESNYQNSNIYRDLYYLEFWDEDLENKICNIKKEINKWDWSVIDSCFEIPLLIQLLYDWIEDCLVSLIPAQKIFFIYEKISENEFNRVIEPIQKVLKSSNLTIDDIDQIELLGGSVRIPKIIEILKENLGANKIGTHMNGDEAVAFGTAFIAANFSSNFRARKMDLYHGANYELRIRLSSSLDHKQFTRFCEENLEDFAIDCLRPLKKETSIFKIRHGYELTRLVSFRHDSDFDVDVYETLEGSEDDNLILKYKVSNITTTIQKAVKDENLTPQSARINLKFKMDRTGMLDFKVISHIFLG